MARVRAFVIETISVDSPFHVYIYLIDKFWCQETSSS